MVDGVALWGAIETSFITSGTATLLATILGVPLGAWCARQTHKGFLHLKTVIVSLYGLPPVVVGVFIYSLLSKSGVLGGLDLLFTVQAMILAQMCLILPLVWGGSWTAFETMSQTYKDTLSTLGISIKQRLLLEIRLARHGVYHSIVLAFGRAIAEVGAVIMVGGNIAGKTRVMTTSIVLETSNGNMDLAGLHGVLLLLISLCLIALAGAVQRGFVLQKVNIDGEQLPSPAPLTSPQRLRCHAKRGDKTILSETEVVLQPGTITAVVGESGAGKTTLLRCLAGLEGLAVRCGPQSTVYVPQQPVLLTTTVASELMMAKTLFADLPSSGKAYGSLFGLESKTVLRVEQLSGGERQRLALARQLSLTPQILLLDECTASLGGLHVQAIEKELLRLKDCGVCLIMATHNIAQAKRLADKILILRDGMLVDENDPFATTFLSGHWV